MVVILREKLNCFNFRSDSYLIVGHILPLNSTLSITYILIGHILSLDTTVKCTLRMTYRMGRKFSASVLLCLVIEFHHLSTIYILYNASCGTILNRILCPVSTYTITYTLPTLYNTVPWWMKVISILSAWDAHHVMTIVVGLLRIDLSSSAL